MEKENFENTMLVTGMGRLARKGAFMRPRVKAFSALAFAAALFSAVTFFSCENSSGPSTAALFAVKAASESSAKAAKIVKLTGTVGGALPSAVSASAKPDVSDSARFVYFARAEAKDASGAVIATSKGTFGTAGTSSANKFEIPLEIGKTWTIICGIKDTKGTAAEGDDVEVYVDSFTKNITADEPAITHAFYPAPKTGAEETGDVALEISVSGTQTVTVAAAWEETGLTAPTVSGISGGKVTISATGVKAGSHKLVVSFRSSSGEVLYSTAQTISVFGGMKTDKWVEDGSAGITSSGFAVDDSLLASVLPECIYVGVPNGLPNSDGVSASDFNSGHLMEPLASLDAAFKKIEKNGSGSSSYKIFVTGNASGELSGNSTLSAAATKARSVTVQSAAGAGQAVLKGDGTDSVITIDSTVPVTFKNIKITGGNASDRGGGIRAKNGSSLTIESGTLITGNKAGARGGGISTGGIFKMKGGEVSGNESGQIGGGIFFEAEAGSSFDVEAEICGSGALIKGNTAKKTAADWDGMGGGLYIGNNATVAMSAGEIKGNNAERGGGGVRVSGSGAKFELSGSGKITGNTADAQGGGIDDDAAFEMTGGEISGNTAPKGGAVHLNGSYTGGTYALASFKIGGAAKIPCSGGEGNNDVYACRASSGSDDGGKYPLVQVLSGGFSLPSGTKAATLTPQDWQRGLDILEASSGDIDSYKGYFALTDGDFNFSKKSGSATIAKLKAPIYIKATGSDSSSASGTKSAPYKTLNYAVTNLSGGEPDTILIIGKVGEQEIPGLSTDRCSALTIKGVVDDSNPSSPAAPEINASGRNTSALVLNAAAPITIQNLKITGGLGVTEGSYSYGGGIKLTAGTLCLADGAIVTGNKATYGGGVYVKKGASLYMYGTALIGDSADTPATGTEPETGTDGAWTNCGNYASSDGGGIYSQGSVYLGYSGTVSGNLVPAPFTGGVKRNLSNSTSGGISSYGTGTASDNRSVLKMRAGYVSFNKACNTGGGIKACQSNVEIADGEMSHNQGKEGGGIYIAADSDVAFSGGTIKENTATASESYQGGGAVYVMSENTASFTMSGSASIPYGGAKNNNDLLLGCATDSYGKILRNASLKIASALTASGTAATITLGKWQRGVQFLGVGGTYSALTEGDLGKFDFTDLGWEKERYNKDNPGSSTATKNAAKIDADIYVAGSSPEKCKTTAGASAPTDTGNTSGNWAHPFASISGALSSGLLDSSHQAIVVDGTVTGAQQQVPSTFTTSLPDGLTIKGYKASSTAASAAAIKRYANPSTATAASNGSALKIDNDTVPVTIEDLAITGGKTSGNGGGINIVKGTVKLGDGAKIAGNEASGLGGGVCVDGSDAALFMYGSSLIGDSVTSTTLAKDGTSASATTFANKAGQHGGGIYNNGGKVYIGYSGLSGSTPVKSDMASGYGVRRNIAYTSGSTSYHGGGIMNRNGGTVRIASGSISYNYSSYDGGGLYNNTDAGDVIIEAPQTASNKAVFEGNKAKGNGGAICNKKTLTMSAGQIGGSGVQNTVDSGAKGGAIFQDGTFNISGSAVVYAGSETVNDVYLGTTSRTITVGSLDGSGTVATITPAEWKRGTNILSATSSIASATYNRFAMSKDNGGWDKTNDDTAATKYVKITSPIYVVGTEASGSTRPDTTWGWGMTSGANGTKTSPYASISAALGCPDLAYTSNTITIAGTLKGAQTTGTSVSASEVTIKGYNTSATIDGKANGHALTIAAAKTFTIQQLKITNGNTNTGGGIYISSGTGTVVNLDNGAKVYSNKATSGGTGAGVYVKSGATLNIKNGSEIYSNTAASGTINGAGVYNAGTVVMSGGSIYSNTANLGGAIYNAGSLTMSGGTIGGSSMQNSVSGTGAAGGAIYQNGTFTVSGTAKVYEGSAGTNDVYLSSSSRTVGVGSFDSSNTGTVASVSLYEWKRGTNFLSSSSAISDTVKAQFKLTKDNTGWEKKDDTSSTTKYVYITSPIYVASSAASDSTRIVCSAAPSSGNNGTKTSPYATIAQALADSELTKVDNTITIDGTVAAQTIGSSVTLPTGVTAVTLQGYKASSTATSAAVISGGGTATALTIGLAKTFTVKDIQITNGSASAGGGINITAAATVNLDNGAKVYSNKATSDGKGAGVNVVTGATLNIKSGALIYSNSAASGNINGAGVYNAGTVDMTGGQIYNNTANNGGGVYNTGTLYVRGTALIGDATSNTNTATGNTAGSTCSNSAANYGGGIYNSGNLYFGCDSSGSSSTTGYALSTDYGVRRNYANDGGGIYNTGTFKSGSGSISYNYAPNSAGGLYAGGSTNNMGGLGVSYNKTGKNGAGVYVASSKSAEVTAQSGVNHNTATASSGSSDVCGGGIYVAGTLTTTETLNANWNSASITGGSGKAYGGCVYIASGGKFVYSKGQLGGTSQSNTVSNTVSGSTDKAYGGSIYQDGTFEVSAKGYIPKGSLRTDDVYLPSEKYITVTGELKTNSNLSQMAITPSTWKRGTQVLSFGSGVTASDEIGKFKGSETDWKTVVDSSVGKLYTEYKIYVSSSGTSSGTGTSSNPYNSISTAVDQCWTTGKDFTIYVSGNLSGQQTIPAADSTNKTGLAKSITLSGENGSSSDGINRNLTSASTKGTALVINTSYPVTLTKLKIQKGYISGSGGGILVNGVAGAKLTLGDDVTITANNATGGAGIYFEGTSSSKGNLILKGSSGKISSISANTASNSGGGVYLKYANLCMSGYSVIGDTTASKATSGSKSNSAKYGGGVYCDTGAAVWLGYSEANASKSDTLQSSYGICRNYASDSTYSGGGIYFSAAGTHYMSSGSVDYNGAAAAGGGVYLSTGTLNIAGGTISNNAATSGGGLYIGNSNSAIAKLYGSSVIDGNTATNGGGVYVDGATGSGGSATRGKLLVYGGGLIGKTGNTIADSGTYGNKATSYGGGIYNKGTVCIGYSAWTSSSSNTPTTCSNGVRRNYASTGGGIYSTEDYIYLHAGNVAYNYASSSGGGVALDDNTYYSYLEMNGGTISYNKCGAVKGSGVYAIHGSITMSGGTINNNTNATQGGGVYLDSSSSLRMQNVSGGTTSGTIKDNTATYGGAVYMDKCGSSSGITLKGAASIPKGSNEKNDIYVNATSNSSEKPKISISEVLTNSSISLVTGSSYFYAEGYSIVSGYNSDCTNCSSKLEIKSQSSQDWTITTTSFAGTLAKAKKLTSSNIASFTPTASTSYNFVIDSTVSADDMKTFLEKLCNEEVNTGKVKIGSNSILDLSKYNLTSIASMTFGNSNDEKLVEQTFAKVILPATNCESMLANWRVRKCLSGAKEFVVAPGSTIMCTDSYGVVYNADKTKIIYYPAASTRTSYTWPSTVEEVGDYAFALTKNLTTMNIPSTVKKLGFAAFSQSKFQSVTVPSSVTTFDSNGETFWGCKQLTTVTVNNSEIALREFAYCSNLTTVTLNNSLTKIGALAFESTSVTTITIPGSVTYIGVNAFPTNMTSMTFTKKDKWKKYSSNGSTLQGSLTSSDLTAANYNSTLHSCVLKYGN